MVEGATPAGTDGGRMRLSWNEIRTRAADFAGEWADETYEKGETQSFYNEFFDIFGVRSCSWCGPSSACSPTTPGPSTGFTAASIQYRSPMRGPVFRRPDRILVIR